MKFAIRAVALGLLAGLCISARPAVVGAGHVTHEHVASKDAFSIDAAGRDVADKSAAPADQAAIGVDEKPGGRIPDAAFKDENGLTVSLSAFIVKPTLILPVYYQCPQACPIMLSNLANALNGVSLTPGADYRVIALGFDPDDGPADALRAKNDYFKLLRIAFPSGDWKFLTGSRENIRRFTEAIGFRYQRTGPRMFAHPNVLVAVSPNRTVIRYLYGPNFLPFDIGMALTEAEKGTPSISIRKLLSYCFTYKEDKKTYTFDAVRFIVIGILVLLGVMLFVLIRGKKRPPGGKHAG